MEIHTTAAGPAVTLAARKFSKLMEKVSGQDDKRNRPQGKGRGPRLGTATRGHGKGEGQGVQDSLKAPSLKWLPNLLALASLTELGLGLHFSVFQGKYRTTAPRQSYVVARKRGPADTGQALKQRSVPITFYLD